MKFIKFDDYIRESSNDIKTFIKKVAIATNEGFDFPYFNVVKSDIDIMENFDMPIIMTEGFKGKSYKIFESDVFTYNRNNVPKFNKIIKDLSESAYSPKTTNDITKVKKLKFPIKATSNGEVFEFKTIGKLKSSERIYDEFTESPVAKTRYTILTFKGKPISITETINKFKLDVDMKRFKFINEANDISKLIDDSYNNLDFYNIEVVESMSSQMLLTGVNRNIDLNPLQAAQVYEAAYKDYYQSRLPNWVKKEMFNESTLPYYQTMALDIKLIKSNNSINYYNYLK